MNFTTARPFELGQVPRGQAFWRTPSAIRSAAPNSIYEIDKIVGPQLPMKPPPIRRIRMTWKMGGRSARDSDLVGEEHVSMW